MLELGLKARVCVTTFAVLAAACGSGPMATVDGPSTAAKQRIASAPTGGQRATVRQARRHIKHVVFLIKENRTFDNYFARYPGADGARYGRTSDGRRIKLEVAPDVMYPDLGHDFVEGLRGIDGGKMDGFDRVRNGKSLNGYSSFVRRGIPHYWAYADHFVLGDRMFSSMHGPTLPQHLYAVGAKAGRVVLNRLHKQAGIGDYCADPSEHTRRFRHLTTGQRGTVKRWEFSHRPGRVKQYWEKVRACLNFRVLPDELRKHHVSWHYFDENTGWFNPLLFIRHAYRSAYYDRHVTSVEEMAPKANAFTHSWAAPDPLTGKRVEILSLIEPP